LRYLKNNFKLIIGGKAKFNNIDDVNTIVADRNVPFAPNNTSHWMLYANPESDHYHEGTGVNDIFETFKNNFKSTFAGKYTINEFELEDEEAEEYTSLISNLIVGRYANIDSL